MVNVILSRLDGKKKYGSADIDENKMQVEEK